MQRLCFTFEIYRGMEDEYKKRHDEIWPELVAASRRPGSRTTPCSAAASRSWPTSSATPTSRPPSRARGERGERTVGGVVQGHDRQPDRRQGRRAAGAGGLASRLARLRRGGRGARRPAADRAALALLDVLGAERAHRPARRPARPRRRGHGGAAGGGGRGRGARRRPRGRRSRRARDSPRRRPTPCSCCRAWPCRPAYALAALEALPADAARGLDDPPPGRACPTPSTTRTSRPRARRSAGRC